MKENRLETEQYISDLIDKSLLEDDERKYWKDLLPEMTQNQLLKLVNIIVLDQKEQIVEFNLELMTEYGEI